MPRILMGVTKQNPSISSEIFLSVFFPWLEILQIWNTTVQMKQDGEWVTACHMERVRDITLQCYMVSLTSTRHEL